MNAASQEPLWTPTPERIAASGLTRFMKWLAESKGLRFADYDALWSWSVDHIEEFLRVRQLGRLDEPAESMHTRLDRIGLIHVCVCRPIHKSLM